MSDQERMKRLNAAFDAMSDGRTEAELADMTSTMTGVKNIATYVSAGGPVDPLVSRQSGHRHAKRSRRHPHR